MSKFFDRFTYLTTKYLKIGSVEINEISTDGTFAGNSDLCVPTEKATKTYIAAVLSGSAAAAFIEDPAGAAAGDMLYYDGDDWVVLTPSAAGDMIYFDGTDWQVVSASAGDLFYFDGTDVTTVTASASGDIIYYDGADYQVLAIGTTNQVLAASSSGLPYWKTA